MNTIKVPTYANPAEEHPLSQLIAQLRASKQNLTFDDLKQELTKKSKIQMKETEDLCILYYNEPPNDTESTLLDRSCRSVILDKQKLSIIGCQFNRIAYNEEAVDLLKKTDWSNVAVQKCYEGTVLLVFHNNNEWFVSTRRCLRSEESSWVKGRSYRDMFNEAFKTDITTLNPNLCYHFVLVHYKNKNIVNYSEFGNEYKEVFHMLTTEKYTMKEVQVDVPGVNKVSDEQISSLDSLLNNINAISQHNEFQQKITIEGYILRVYGSDGTFTVAKLQTPIYQTVSKLKPNNNNIYQAYLELYQTDNLSEYGPYFTDYSAELVKRIHTSMKNMAKEVLDLYHSTRQKKNINVYSKLTEQYKKVLYGLHGRYIQQRKGDFINGKPDTNKLATSVNVHDVYYYLKSLPPAELRQLYYDRTKLIEDDANTFINKNCIYTKTQCTQMFNG